MLQRGTYKTPQKIILLKKSNIWKVGIYQGSADSCEGDCHSDLNRLASVIFRQYNTVTNKCLRLPRTWIWHIQYCDCWSHFDSRPGSVYSITRKILLQLDGVFMLRLFGLFEVIVLWSTRNMSIYYISLLIITKLCLSQKIESTSLWYFAT